MNKKEVCENCRFYSSLAEWYRSRENEGECRVRSPKIIPDADDIGRWPVVSKDSWCGEYQPKNKK